MRSLIQSKEGLVVGTIGEGVVGVVAAREREAGKEEREAGEGKR